MKVALIHEALTVYGGAEKVLEEFAAMFPQAPIFVPIYEPHAFPETLRGRDVRTTWLDRMPFVQRYARGVFPLYPSLMNSIDLDDFDLVLSSSFNFAHNVATPPETCHVCYCHSPARFLWDYNGYARREGFGAMERRVIEFLLPRLRTMDRTAALGVDTWISTSSLVERRIRKIYRRESTIVPPPVNTRDFFISSHRDGYFLLLMRLVGWKRADIAVRACTELGLPLKVAGDGRDLARLKEMAGPTVEFVGRVDGRAKAELYANAAALILTSLEDFGITPLEAMAAGRPVLAYGQGGVLDTVVPGVTGAFFAEQTAESLKQALTTFEPGRYDPNTIRRHAETFDSASFRRRMHTAIDKAMEGHARSMALEPASLSASDHETVHASAA
ncbi:glycosyltransferase [Pararhizobium mangrovi]|uniref:Glycosyltransferase family 4 protein n=1 Tax=Pararhizobium mangrovi TaxID=2590452 RepID=A0A506U4I5_9HYPH|nr:glycosyltransferase [Pararhizobium mangrovi]TPW27925.1 glycosyltransferase family 4 protein [Pararhizobium mangrovi]